MRVLARRHGINQKTVARWKKRESTADRRTGPTVPRSTVSFGRAGGIIVAFRKHTLLPLDDCLYALQGYDPSDHSLFPSSVFGTSRHQPPA
jgi:hypothetical protein